MSRTPFLSPTGRGFTGKVYAALQIGRRGGGPGGTLEFSLARGPSFVGSEVTRSVTTRDPEPAKFRLPGEDRTSTAPRGLRCQTKDRGSSPPGTMRRAFAALASGGTAASRWPEGLRHQRSNEAHHHPEQGAAEFAANSYLSVAALYGAPPSEPLFGSPCHRCPALASFPPTGPALLGARFRASPGIRVSRSGRSRKNSTTSGPGVIKKTLRSSAREGPLVRIFDLISDEIAPMSCAGAQERRMAVQIFDCQIALASHRATRIRHRGPSPNEAGL